MFTFCDRVGEGFLDGFFDDSRGLPVRFKIPPSAAKAIRLRFH
jgi:hypothetical protein